MTPDIDLNKAVTNHDTLIKEATQLTQINLLDKPPDTDVPIRPPDTDIPTRPPDTDIPNRPINILINNNPPDPGKPPDRNIPNRPLDIDIPNKVKHLGNFINTDCNEITDCNFLKSLFIGYVNKLGSNFGKLQSKVLINLFKSYCCSFYGSHLWKFNSTGFDKCCKAWNIAIRKLLELPYNAHVYLLCLLVRQINIREQFYVRNYRFLWNAFRSRNHIVSTCMNMALDNSNTCNGYKLALYRYRYVL